MGRNSEVHPDPCVLQSFALGKVQATVADTLTEHLETCDACRQIVAAAGPDDFIRRLREAKRSGESPTLRESIPAALLSSAEYEVLRVIKRGGMGVVYLVQNRGLDRLEALKLIRTPEVASPEMLERFEREIRVAASLKHHHIVTVYRTLQLQGLIAFTMEYIDGMDLEELVKRHGPLPVGAACECIREAAEGLEEADKRRFLHRDIKPSNLMLASEGRNRIIKILDFGLAKVVGEFSGNPGLTGSAVLGTPHYVAPEQINRGGDVDIRADIYGLGCTLYFLLAGKPPFAGKASMIEILDAHRFESARPISELRDDIPAELTAILGRMMAREAGRRYQRPGDVISALEPFAKTVDLRLGRALEGYDTSPARSPAISDAEFDDSNVSSASDDKPITMALSAEVVASQESDTCSFSGIESQVVNVAARGPRSTTEIMTEADFCEVLRSANGDEPPGRVRAESRARRTSRRARWITALGITGVLLFGIVIILKNKDGSTRRIEIPPDTREIVIDLTDETDSTGPAKDATREIVESVVAVGGKFAVRSSKLWGWPEKWLDRTADLPEQYDGLMFLMVGSRCQDADLARIGKLKAPLWLDLSHTKITDDGLASLRDMKNLEVLHLESTSVTRAALKNLGAPPRLESLHIANTSIIDRDLALLQNLPMLRGLQLGKSQLTANGIAALASLKELVALEAADGAGKDEYNQIGNLSRLANLAAAGKSVTDECLEPLGRLKDLHGLGLYGTSVTNAGVARLHFLAPELKWLTIARGSLTDISVKHISALQKLESVVLESSGVSASGADALRATLTGCQITWRDADLPSPTAGPTDREIARWVLDAGGKVEALNKGETIAISDPSGLPQVCESLRLDLAGCQSVADVDLRRLRKLTVPFSLELERTAITDAGLTSLQGLSTLRTLTLGGLPISRAGIENLGELPELEGLNLGGTNVTATDLQILSRFPKLTFLRVGHAHLNENGIQQLSRFKTLTSMGTTEDVGVEDIERLCSLKQLTTVSILGPGCTDSCIKYLGNLPNLTRLGLYWTSVTDSGITKLPEVAPQLELLNLVVARIHDPAAGHLTRLHRLKYLTFYKTEVSDAMISQLQAALPDCKIERKSGD